ncbi:transposase [Candidatus Daviesbacteria bacterium]|nr:transposase [Candidatus Daviesbacteria bacterium]
MPYRKVPIVTSEIYHVFNRAVAGIPIFSTSIDFLRFLDLINYYRFKNTPVSFSQLKNIEREQRKQIFDDLIKENHLHIEILAFCLMDNHFHFLLKQKLDRGIVKFISNLQNSYAKYFNAKSARNGPLFQPMFKTVRITTEEQFLHVSRYIHLNPSTSYLVEIKDLESYPWSSLLNYIGEGRYPFVDTKQILGIINEKKYREFVFNQADYQRELGMIKHLTLE